jgi:hypothetical protein
MADKASPLRKRENAAADRHYCYSGSCSVVAFVCAARSVFFFPFFAVLGFELRAFTSPFCDGFSR